MCRCVGADSLAKLAAEATALTVRDGLLRPAPDHLDHFVERGGPSWGGTPGTALVPGAVGLCPVQGEGVQGAVGQARQATGAAGARPALRADGGNSKAGPAAAPDVRLPATSARRTELGGP